LEEILMLASQAVLLIKLLVVMEVQVELTLQVPSASLKKRWMPLIG